MRISSKIVLTALVVGLCSISGQSYADSKPWIWSWGPGHWVNQDFEPYVENGKHPHNTQWEKKSWSPLDWETQRHSDLAVISGFYKSGILNGQYYDDDVPVLVVGPNFYKLGGEDKRRVAEMIDYTYGVTNSHENAVFMLEDWKSHDIVGAYTKYGLQIQ